MRDERPRFRMLGRLAAGTVAVVLFGTAMTGCARWPGPYLAGGHLEDNPFDQAISSGMWSTASDGARQRLLARYPVGSPVIEIRRYLESIGASCERARGGPFVCKYSQHGFVGYRGIIGDERREYWHFDFTVRIRPSNGPIAKLAVCSAYTKEVERGPMIFGSRHNKPRRSSFKPCV